MRFLKVIILFAGFLSMIFPADAQHWTVWYGVGLSNEMKAGPLTQWHFANGGVDYTIPASRWDFTIGAGLSTKGGLLRANYVQLEGNAGYRFLDLPYGFRLSALMGPFFGVRVADNRKDWVPFMPELKPCLFGWQAGFLLGFKFVALKIGYEQALTGYYDKSVSTQYVNADGKPSFPTSKPHSLFIRLGFEF